MELWVGEIFDSTQYLLITKCVRKTLGLGIGDVGGALRAEDGLVSVLCQLLAETS